MSQGPTPLQAPFPTKDAWKLNPTKSGQGQPIQLSLFQFRNDEQHLANIIDFYDAIPRFIPYKLKRAPGHELDPILREFKYAGKVYTVSIKPALIPDKKSGKSVPAFPGVREELIEHTLRKIAATPGGSFFRNSETKADLPKVGVLFTYYGLQQELAKTGHKFSISELIEGVTVLEESVTLLTTGDKSQDLKLRSIRYSERLHRLGPDGKPLLSGKSVVVALFHDSVAQAIMRGDYRALNHYKHLMPKRWLTRWLRRRLSSRYKQAQVCGPFYEITLHGIIRDSGLQRGRLRDAIREICAALDDMKRQGDLSKWEFKEVRGEKYNRINPDKSWYVLHPSEAFSQEQIEGNMRAKRNAILLDDASN